MKDNTRIMYHPNQENKTGKARYASFTSLNFSNNESLPGKKVHMEIVRDKKSWWDEMRNLIQQLIRNFWFTRM